MTEQTQINFDSPAGLTREEADVLCLLKKGRENSISMSALAEAVGVCTREVQTIVKHLVEDHQVLIASATGKHHGFFLPENEEEFRAAAAQLEHRIISLAKRLRAINKESYEEIFGQGKLLQAEVEVKVKEEIRDER
jgi:DNA-binding IclR family transcriptional regulator